MLINKYHIEGDIAYLEVSDQVTMIDTSDLEKALQVRWYATPHMMGGYYVFSRHEGKTVYLHRYVLDAPKGMTVDHINHDTLDNRRSNLRIVSNQENNANRNGAFSTSQTGMRGISTHKHADGGLAYVFRCHCVTCKVARYFPHTEEGLEEAIVYATWHFKAMENPEEAGPEPEKVQHKRVVPVGEATGKIDAIGVSIARTRTGTYYFFRCRRPTCPRMKYFPLTEEGLEAAKAFSEEHYAALK